MKKRNTAIRVLLMSLAVIALSLSAVGINAVRNNSLSSFKTLDELDEYILSNDDLKRMSGDELIEFIIAERNKILGIEPETKYDEFAGLDENQREQMESLREKGRRAVGYFWRQEKIIKGEIDADSPKLTLERALSIIAEHDSFADILSEFEKVQEYPDYAGGSGISIREYWLDENGEEKILIIKEQGEIFLDNAVNGTSEQLFGRISSVEAEGDIASPADN